ncbi:MAG: undecaprenyldiphospho-muramoylpentapeptide beta-N-acetylglucosaminyltransferase [Acidobacteria bacterium]|nr:MAG: undecaprenyldiphospho-muramoylpentapeptide beta-N-acetylglucosaminyltransferase [Acidobacteriota bacterium]REK13895.1 MAG: undecaprenyldiphospho-muramoylpentapeptide beta-N-acetylglucosaminyltransferase [Acidobacteriota bacterium]REK41889.1 MAG: undecaprenyldiphospho-muramoylpentapeptide beta-N-acetylglucosaminyltransferase [Acidobacteriota bacterium]
MKVIIAAGGTGGHIYPGIAVAKEIVSRGGEVLFVGAKGGLENRIVPENGFPIETISSSGLKSMGIAGKVKGLAILPKSFLDSLKILRKFKPDVVAGAGGYVSGPVLLMASFSRIPTLVMDSNALPGFTNRQLAPFVTKAALAFEEALEHFGKKGIVIGNPVRNEFFSIGPSPDGDKVNLFLTGGSQGARGINTAMVDALGHLADVRDRLRITHQTGEPDLETVRKGYADAGWKESEVTAYVSDMMGKFRDAHLLVTRAGATTCAELAAAGRPAIMVPLPTAADDHQRKNAEAMQDAGAARMILQKDLTGQRLASEIKELIADSERLRRMSESARKLAKNDAAKAAADIIEELAAGGKR